MTSIQPRLNVLILHTRDIASLDERLLFATNISMALITGVYPGIDFISVDLVNRFRGLQLSLNGIISAIVSSPGGEPRRMLLASVIQMFWDQIFDSIPVRHS